MSDHDQRRGCAAQDRDEWEGDRIDPPACPRCGFVDRRPTVWGMPNEEDFAAAARGEVKLGGCVMPDGVTPITMECPSCGQEWVDGKA